MNQINEKISQLLNNQVNSYLVFNPLFFRIRFNEDLTAFEKLLDTPGLVICDTLQDQLKEYVKLMFPARKFTDTELNQEALAHIGNLTLAEYGVWVFYPWSKKLVHVLDKEEFINLRTSRNQNKITRAEQKHLEQKKIGVIGLSVGQSVAATIAMERICGELRLADFDTLELTNLNRIRTGIHNLGLPKVYSVAREIFEIDPFFKIKCFPEGITENNIDSFFLEGGKLDLMIEESDGFDIKIISRYKARELGVPVLMEASDRCMVDVERFDLEPNRPILHGLVEHIDIPTLKNLQTTEEKIPYMLDILGLKTASTRLKASMIEIEQTINTWPQLASAVTMGGGITADVSRRILLNQYSDSGRYYVDIEEIIGNKNKTTKNTTEETHFPPVTEDLMEKAVLLAIASINNPTAIILTEDLIQSWLQKAIAAPSAGNNQPWKWYVTDEMIFLFHDKNKSAGWSDPFDSLAHIGLGAALQNLKLAALHSGYDSDIHYFPLKEQPLLIAGVSFAKSNNLISATNENLFQSIDLRCTNRKKGNKKAIEYKLLETVSNVVAPSADVIYTQQEDEINEMADIVSLVEKIRFLHPKGHKEFFEKEIRWTADEANKTRDGLDIATLELSLKDEVGLKVASEEEVITKVREWKGGAALQKLTKDAVINSSAIGLLRLSADQKNTFINGGEAMQKVWLTANHLGISLQPISSPLFFFDRIQKLNDLDDETIKILFELEQRFLRIFPQNKNFTNIFLFRLYTGDSPTKRSLRRNLNESLVVRQLKNV